jgi:hypothetical protein
MRTKLKPSGGGPFRRDVDYLADVVHGRLQTPVRAELIRSAMAVIVSKAYLDEYFKQLDPKLLADEQDVFDENVIATVVKQGVGCLASNQIAALFTDPVALLAIHSTVLERKPNAWVRALSECFVREGFSTFQKRIRDRFPDDFKRKGGK